MPAWDSGSLLTGSFEGLIKTSEDVDRSDFNTVRPAFTWVSPSYDRESILEHLGGSGRVLGKQEATDPIQRRAVQHFIHSNGTNTFHSGEAALQADIVADRSYSSYLYELDSSGNLQWSMSTQLVDSSGTVLGNDSYYALGTHGGQVIYYGVTSAGTGIAKRAVGGASDTWTYIPAAGSTVATGYWTAFGSRNTHIVGQYLFTVRTITATGVIRLVCLDLSTGAVVYDTPWPLTPISGLFGVSIPGIIAASTNKIWLVGVGTTGNGYAQFPHGAATATPPTVADWVADNFTTPALIGDGYIVYVNTATSVIQTRDFFGNPIAHGLTTGQPLSMSRSFTTLFGGVTYDDLGFYTVTVVNATDFTLNDSFGTPVTLTGTSHTTRMALRPCGWAGAALNDTTLYMPNSSFNTSLSPAIVKIDTTTGEPSAVRQCEFFGDVETAISIPNSSDVCYHRVPFTTGLGITLSNATLYYFDPSLTGGEKGFGASEIVQDSYFTSGRQNVTTSDGVGLTREYEGDLC